MQVLMLILNYTEKRFHRFKPIILSALFIILITLIFELLQKWVQSLLWCVYTGRKATCGEGWQPSRMVTYVTFSNYKPTTQLQQLCLSGIKQQLAKFATG